jgi:hypothetical protein
MEMGQVTCKGTADGYGREPGGGYLRTQMSLDLDAWRVCWRLSEMIRRCRQFNTCMQHAYLSTIQSVPACL